MGRTVAVPLIVPASNAVARSLAGALDHRQTIPVMVTFEQSPALFNCFSSSGRSGVPGLINTALGGAGEPIACTPRDLTRRVSSAVDALVIRRCCAKIIGC
jgi:predicted NodU family carbamoyl transferase